MAKDNMKNAFNTPLPEKGPESVTYPQGGVPSTSKHLGEAEAYGTDEMPLDPQTAPVK